MSRRAEQVDETHQRIVEAAVQLHGTVGPAATTIAAIAEVAGVTRLTVYRHFPDDVSLYAACSAHWQSTQVMPDPGAWAEIVDPIERLNVGLADLYRFYRAGESMLIRIYRDKAALPRPSREALDDRHRRIVEMLSAPFGRHPRTVIAAVIGHAASFETWRSLCSEHGLSDAQAIQLATDLVTRRDVPRRRAPTQ